MLKENMINKWRKGLRDPGLVPIDYVRLVLFSVKALKCPIFPLGSLYAVQEIIQIPLNI